MAVLSFVASVIALCCGLSGGDTNPCPRISPKKFAKGSAVPPVDGAAGSIVRQSIHDFNGTCVDGVCTCVTGINFLESVNDGYINVRLNESAEYGPSFISRFHLADGVSLALDVECNITGSQAAEKSGGFGLKALGSPTVWRNITTGEAKMWFRAENETGAEAILLALSYDFCYWSAPAPVVWKSEEWAGKEVISRYVRSIFKVGAEFWMYYTGVDNTSQSLSSIGLATSSDGITWIPYAGNPVLDRKQAAWHSSVVSDPYVWQDAIGRFLMLFSGHNVTTKTHIGMAASWDGKTWRTCSDEPLIKEGSRTDDAYFRILDGRVYYRRTDKIDAEDGGAIFQLVMPDLYSPATLLHAVVITCVVIMIASLVGLVVVAIWSKCKQRKVQIDSAVRLSNELARPIHPLTQPQA